MLNIVTNESVVTIPLADLRSVGLGVDWSLLTTPDAVLIRAFRDQGRTLINEPEVADFQGLIRRTDFVELLRTVLTELSEAYEYPVDVEFTANLLPDDQLRLNIVQCRPLQTQGPGAVVALPSNPAPAQTLFSATGNFMGGNVRIPLDYVVAVSPKNYLALSTVEKHEVARAIGKINAAMGERGYLLLGPGRWGTTTESLGVPVRFAEIAGAKALVEVTYPEGNFQPELSYGSHFFLDLVEHGMFYAAIFAERQTTFFNPKLLTSRPNLVADLLGEPSNVIWVVAAEGLELFSDLATQQVVCTQT